MGRSLLALRWSKEETGKWVIIFVRGGRRRRNLLQDRLIGLPDALELGWELLGFELPDEVDISPFEIARRCPWAHAEQAIRIVRCQVLASGGKECLSFIESSCRTTMELV